MRHLGSDTQTEKFKTEGQKKSQDQRFIFLLSTYLSGSLNKKSKYLLEGN